MKTKDRAQAERLVHAKNEAASQPANNLALAQTKEKRGITFDEQQKIIAGEKNPERRLYYELLWEIGASQSDAVALTIENIDWQKRVFWYDRSKNGAPARLKFGAKLEAILKQLPTVGFFSQRLHARLTVPAPLNSLVAVELWALRVYASIATEMHGQSARGAAVIQNATPKRLSDMLLKRFTGLTPKTPLWTSLPWSFTRPMPQKSK